MIAVRYYVEAAGRSPFEDWYYSLPNEAGAKVAVAFKRIELGNLSNTKSVAEGVIEYRIDFGPGYRVYFGRDGPVLAILLGGGTKKRQPQDIAAAQARWQDYKRRKPGK